jgi:hypothetical protein
MKKIILNLSYLTFLAFVLSSCYPGGAETTSETDIVITNYDDSYNFSAAKTYFMSDSIQHIVDDGNTANMNYDQLIISQLASNFEARGYVRLFPSDTLTHPESPDFMVVITTLETTTTVVYGGYPWYGGWGWGYGWKKSTDYYPYYGYGWGYPYYPTYVTSYSTGTIVWDMFDPDNVDDEGEIINVAWLGALNGLLGTTSSTSTERIKSGIDQAFLQSPYIQSN